jgi:hypothetical protein
MAVLFLHLLIDWLIDYDGVRLMSQNHAHHGLLFIPRVSVSGELWLWWWCQLGTTPDSSTGAHWQSYQQRHLERVGGMDETMIILHIRYLSYVNGPFTCSKFLQHGTSGSTSHPKEGVLRIFIALKNPSPQLSLNLQPLGPVASTLTTTPQRWWGRLGTWWVM